jgi:GTP-binding protein
MRSDWLRKGGLLNLASFWGGTTKNPGYEKDNWVLNWLDPSIPQGDKPFVTNEEKSLALHLLSFQDYLDKAVEEYKPSTLCRYAIELCQYINSYYQSHHIIDESNLEQTAHRIAMIQQAQELSWTSYGFGLCTESGGDVNLSCNISHFSYTLDNAWDRCCIYGYNVYHLPHRRVGLLFIGLYNAYDLYYYQICFISSGANYTQCPGTDRPEYAFIGRSNVGKSTLINVMCGKRELAKTSVKPGKTQLINYFDIQIANEAREVTPIYLVDLPGYGYARVNKVQRQDREVMIDDYLQKKENLTMIFVLIDSRHAPQAIDISFIERLHQCQRPYTLIFTKSDKSTQKELAANLKLFMIALSQLSIPVPRYFVTTSEKKYTTQEIVQYMMEV